MKRNITMLSFVLVAMINAVAGNNDDIPFTTIVDEDFSGLTAGTPEMPDETPLLDDLGWFVDATLLKPYDEVCTYGWGGDKAYSAGGCLAIMGGFINTPTGNYSGNLRVTFRARLMDSETADEAKMDILLCRRSALIDYERLPVVLTHEWKEYTLEATNGWFRDCIVQLFTYNDEFFLVDDFKIVHQITSIEPPVATDAYELTDDGFTAYWNRTADAKEYLLSVYSKRENPDAEEVTEGFDSINVKGGKIDADHPNTPDYWTVNATDVCTTDFQSAPYSIALADNGQSITSPRSDVPLTKIGFWARIDDNGQTGKASGFVNVYANTDYGWFLWTYFGVEGSRGAGGFTDLSDVIGVFDNIYQIRIEYENPNNDKCRVLVDDVEYYAPGTYEKLFVFEDKKVDVPDDMEDPSHECYGLDPDTDYYYYVKARNERFTSEPSNEMEVFDVSNPVALPATSVTSTGYTANWQSHNKVDFFRIDQMRVSEVKEDTPGYVVLAEDFSKVHSKGTAEAPEYGTLTTDYYSIDEYTHTGGWKATSPMYAEGMIGGQAKEQGYIAGCIVTPVLDLSHNGGVCDVKVRAWAYEGDWLVVQGNNTNNYAGINFEETGWVEATVQMPLCESEEQFYFYSNNYYPFMIDDITITQDLKKGDIIALTDKTLQAEAGERSVKVDDVDFRSYPEMQYKVSASRYYHGNKKDIWESPYSKLVSVKYVADGIAENVIRRDVPGNGSIYDTLGRKTNVRRGIVIEKRGGRVVKSIAPSANRR